MNIAFAAKSIFPPYNSESTVVILGAGIAIIRITIARTRGFALNVIISSRKNIITGTIKSLIIAEVQTLLSVNNSEVLLRANAMPIINIDNGVVIPDK